MDDDEGDMWMPDIDELIADDQAVSAAAYDELEDNDFIMMMVQDTGENAARKQDDPDNADGQSVGRGGEGGGRGRAGRARDGDGAGDGETESEWEELMGGCSGEGEGSGGVGGGGTAASAAAPVGVGRARERVGPGKWRRVATLARWEPSARAHMLSHLVEGATVDVTGD